MRQHNAHSGMTQERFIDWVRVGKWKTLNTYLWAIVMFLLGVLQILQVLATYEMTVPNAVTAFGLPLLYPVSRWFDALLFLAIMPGMMWAQHFDEIDNLEWPSRAESGFIGSFIFSGLCGLYTQSAVWMFAVGLIWALLLLFMGITVNTAYLRRGGISSYWGAVYGCSSIIGISFGLPSAVFAWIVFFCVDVFVWKYKYFREQKSSSKHVIVPC